MIVRTADPIDYAPRKHREGPLTVATRTFRRRPRLPVPTMPSGEFQLEPPPEIPRMLPGNIMGALLPGVMVLGSVGFIFIGGLNTASMAMGGLILLSTLGMMGGGMGGRRTGRKTQIDTDRKDYLRYIEQVRRDIERARLNQRTSLLWSHPDPRSLWSVAGGRRMWERRPSDRDFSTVRVGVGPQRLARQLRPPQTGLVESLDPIGAVALRRLIRTHALVDDLPIAVKLRSFPAVEVRGGYDEVRDLTRAVLVSSATFHGPDQLIVGVVTSGPSRTHWDWVKWLPHAQDPRESDAVGARRLVAGSLTDLEEWLSADMSTRARFSRDATPAPDQPHIVIVIDGGAVSLEERVLLEDGLVGVTIIDLSSSIGRLATRRGLRLVVENGKVGAVGRGGVEVLGRADAVSIAEADAIARRMAPWRVGAAETSDEQPLLTSAELVDMLGVGDPENVQVEQLWRPRTVRDRLRIPIGVGEHGEPVELDIKEAALEGMGPHGLVIGATGSGKSELLRTLVLALAMTHSPSALNLILVDFKGGATFLGLQDLPHTAAVITNLQDDLTLVDRMHDALAGEMNRRQELLKTAGNYANVREYERAREAGAPLDPLPSLLIVCDEFTEMLTQKPEFAELFVAIGRLGRSLSMHLMLASQRLEEGKLRGLDSHLSYRIGLKTFSAAESWAVLGVADAYELPSIPGSGYLKFDVSKLVRFKAAYVSGPYRRDTASVGSGVAFARRPLPFLSEPIDLPDAPDEDVVPAPSPEQTGPGFEKSVLDVVVDKLQGHGVPAHEVWLPPLAESPSLDSMLPPLTVIPGRGLGPDGWGGNGRLIVPIGLVDRPYEQRRDQLLLDFSGAAGHGAVVGGPQSGKSTVLRDIITSLALTHTPREAQIYGIDLGGGSLATTAGLPHVGGIASRANPDLVRRMVAEVSGVLAGREERFRANGIEGMAAYRRLERAGHHTDDPFGDVFLIVDGWANFRAEFEDLEQRVTAIAGQGLSFGVHVIVGANRWAEIRAALKDTLGTRIELRLGDPSESEIDRRVAAAVPGSRPGRGLTQQRLHFLAALPRIDGSSETGDVAVAYADLVERVRTSWDGPPAPRVRMLPASVPFADLPQPEGTRRIAIGLNEEELTPVLLDFDADPHFILFSDAESGKTNFLKVLARGIMSRYSSDQARVLLADYRRTMLGYVPQNYLAGYAPAGPALQAFIDDLRPVLHGRLPGPEVTPDQLRDRSWWSGPEIFVLVDDYDMVASPSGNPIAGLAEFLPQAKDVGLHLVLCRRTGGAARALFEPVIQRVRELGSPGIVGSGSRDEGALLGTTRPGPMPPGRGVIVGRRYGRQLVQIAEI
jgi:S-DNA-T family DNA segregation ATPase FtsK/SpoIIIE